MRVHKHKGIEGSKTECKRICFWPEMSCLLSWRGVTCKNCLARRTRKTKEKPR